MAGTELVRVKDLKIVRDGFTLEVREWSVGPGEVVGLVGPNGAG